MSRRRTDHGQLLQPGVAPILGRAEIESHSNQFISFRIIDLELFAAGDRTVIPVIGATAIEVRLADLAPEFASIRAGISVLPKTAIEGMSKGGVEPRGPAWVYRAERAIYRVTKLVHPDAL